METLLIMVLAFAGYIVMYKLYGQYIGIGHHPFDCSSKTGWINCLLVNEVLPGLPLFHVPFFSVNICCMDAQARCLEQVGARRLPAA